MKLYLVRTLFTVLVRCRSIRQCTDCLSASQIKEFVAYFTQYTIISNTCVATQFLTKTIKSAEAY